MAIAQKLRLTGIAIAFSNTSECPKFYSLILDFNHHLYLPLIHLAALISIAFWQGHIRPVYCHPSEFPKQQSSQWHELTRSRK